MIKCLYKSLRQQIKQSKELQEQEYIEESNFTECDSVLVDNKQCLLNNIEEDKNIHKDSEKKNEDIINIDSIKSYKLEIAICEATLCCLVDLAFNDRFSSKIQIIKILRQLSIFGKARKTILKKSINYLFYFTCKLKNNNDHIRDVEGSLEIIRSMIFLNEMEEVFENSKIFLIRCLLFLLDYKLIKSKALSLLKSFEITSEVFDPKIGIKEYDFEISNPEEFYFLKPKNSFEYEIKSDFKNFN